MKIFFNILLVLMVTVFFNGCMEADPIDEARSTGLVEMNSKTYADLAKVLENPKWEHNENNGMTTLTGDFSGPKGKIQFTYSIKVENKIVTKCIYSMIMFEEDKTGKQIGLWNFEHKYDGSEWSGTKKTTNLSNMESYTKKRNNNQALSDILETTEFLLKS